MDSPFLGTVESYSFLRNTDCSQASLQGLTGDVEAIRRQGLIVAYNRVQAARSESHELSAKTSSRAIPKMVGSYLGGHPILGSVRRFAVGIVASEYRAVNA
jgi:hypothetical protein